VGKPDSIGGGDGYLFSYPSGIGSREVTATHPLTTLLPYLRASIFAQNLLNIKKFFFFFIAQVISTYFNNITNMVQNVTLKYIKSPIMYLISNLHG